MINERIKLTIEDNVAHVLLSRPDKMNALDSKMFAALAQAGQQLGDNPEVRAVVVSGEGTAFCAGLDMENFSHMLDSANGSDANSQPSSIPHDLLTRTQGIANDVQYAVRVWRELEVPVIAAVHGVAVGGGFQIALAADMRYAAPNTRFSIMEIKWGLVPDMGSSQLMRHLASEDIIRELTYTGRLFEAEEAKEMGFVTRVCEQPLDQAMQVARQIAHRNPDAIRACKRILNTANYVSEAAGLRMESEEQDKIIGTPNQIEAVMAELNKRPAVFQNEKQ